jgi:hypothetical protein
MRVAIYILAGLLATLAGLVVAALVLVYRAGDIGTALLVFAVFAPLALVLFVPVTLVVLPVLAAVLPSRALASLACLIAGPVLCTLAVSSLVSDWPLANDPNVFAGGVPSALTMAAALGGLAAGAAMALAALVLGPDRVSRTPVA